MPPSTWVRISSPRSIAGCVGFIQQNEIDILLLPPASSSSESSATEVHKQNFDSTPMIPPLPAGANTPPVQIHRKRSRCYDQFGFRYVCLQDVKLDPEPYWPTMNEIELCQRYGRLEKGQYNRLLSRALAYSLWSGDRVLLKAGECAGLIGMVITIGVTDAQVYVPLEGSLLTAPVKDLRHEFRVGDRVAALTDEVAERLGSRIGWVVADLGPSEPGI